MTKPHYGSIPITHEEHDSDANAKRVVLASSTGNTVSYEDTSFVTGDSPAVLDVFTDLGRVGEGGYIINDGEGSFTVEISDNGTAYGGVHTLKAGEIMTLDGLMVNRIRLTWVSNSSYRVLIGHNIKVIKDGYDRVANSLIPTKYDYMGLTYDGGNLSTVVFKTGGVGGTTVSTLTLGYVDGNLSSITQS